MDSDSEGLPDVSGASDGEFPSDPPDDNPLKPGDRIDDFEILEEIGRGGMGIVYKAMDHSLKRIVALKVLHPHIAGNASVAKRFHREAVLAANLSHPNIVPVYRIDDRPIPRYFTMEFVAGRSLKEKVEKEGFLNPAEAVRIGLQICQALGYAHEHNIIHRDIKPSNILLENHLERVRVTDFGIARDLTGELGDVTQTGLESLGTPAFMSPEQNLGRDLDARTDIFSLGMTLYYCLTGRTAYRAANRQELALAFKEQVPKPPSYYNSEVSPAMDGLVMKMLAVDSERRYADVKAAARAMKSLQADGEKAPAKTGKQVRRLPARRILLATTFVLLLAGLIFVVLPRATDCLVPQGFVAKTGTTPEPYTGTGWAREIVHEATGMELVFIPAGTFSMGSPDDEIGRAADEGPQHKVIISRPFYVGKHEVTRQQFSVFVQETGYRTEAERKGWASLWRGSQWSQVPGASWRAPSFPQDDDHPVVCITWNDTTTFCRWMSEQSGGGIGLPTEAQWEYACRAGADTAYEWGSDLAGAKGKANLVDASAKARFPSFDASVGWDDGFVFTAPVGRFIPNRWGVHDMHGNVWEWCRDWYTKDYYSLSPAIDPQGPDRGIGRVVRGSGWMGTPSGSRCARRAYDATDHQVDSKGFRIALQLPDHGASAAVPPPTTPGTVPLTWHSYGGHRYAITQRHGTWEQAEADAVSAGGHLVTINNEAENAWLTDLIATSYTRDHQEDGWQNLAWIGYRKRDGKWGWASGEPVTFTNESARSYQGEPWGWESLNPADRGDHAYLHGAKHAIDPGGWLNYRLHNVNSGYNAIGIIEVR